MYMCYNYMRDISVCLYCNFLVSTSVVSVAGCIESIYVNMCETIYYRIVQTTFVLMMLIPKCVL